MTVSHNQNNKQSRDHVKGVILQWIQLGEVEVWRPMPLLVEVPNNAHPAVLVVVVVP